jgi:hypothetical protein
LKATREILTPSADMVSALGVVPRLG